MKILVTGATGLLGSTLAQVLEGAGHDVRALARSSSSTEHLESDGIEIVRGNLLEPASLDEAIAGTDLVVHPAAAVLGRDQEALRRVNVDGTYALIDRMTRVPDRPAMVYVSSIAAGGFGTSQHPLREDMIPRPATWYGRTKLEAEEIVREHGGRMPVAVLRLATLYGPRDRFFPPLYRLIAFGITPLPDGGDMELSLLHVEDAARAILRVVESDGATGGTWYVADDRPVTWKRFCGVIQSSLRRSVSLPVDVEGRFIRRAEDLLERAGRLPGGIERRLPDALGPDLPRFLLGRGLVCDGSAFRQVTGWSPRWDLATGMKRTMRWYRDRDLV